MEDLKISLNRHCTCAHEGCPIRGNCVLCVEYHKTHRNHIPECMQQMLRHAVAELCEMVELTPLDVRPKHDVFEGIDRSRLIADALCRHQS